MCVWGLNTAFVTDSIPSRPHLNFTDAFPCVRKLYLLHRWLKSAAKARRKEDEVLALDDEDRVSQVWSHFLTCCWLRMRGL